MLTEALAANDDTILRSYLDGEHLADDRLHAGLAEQTAARLLHPVYFGSALTGGGADELLTGIVGLLPTSRGRPHRSPRRHGLQDPARAERRQGRARPHVLRHADDAGSDRARRPTGPTADRVTGIRVFEHGTTSERPLDHGR